MKNLLAGHFLKRMLEKRICVLYGTGTGFKFIKKEQNFHVTSQQKYPSAIPLPIPPNIDPTESTRFSPQRSRDISAIAIISYQPGNSPQSTIDITLDRSNNDPHVDSYDCFGAVSLNSAMQSNVPSPFGGLNKFTHLNMPGGQWSQENKFMSHDLQSSHYMNLRREARAGWANYNEDAVQEKGINILSVRNHGTTQFQPTNLHVQLRMFSTINDTKKTENLNDKHIKNKEESKKLSRKEVLKRAVKDYGATVIVFHVGISLISLGCFYLMVNSGVNLVPVIQSVGIGTESISENVISGASTFFIAYIIHKMFAPIRISITLGATPFIVRYLRNKGILKTK